jgi:hypothetical protein
LATGSWGDPTVGPRGLRGPEAAALQGGLGVTTITGWPRCDEPPRALGRPYRLAWPYKVGPRGRCDEPLWLWGFGAALQGGLGVPSLLASEAAFSNPNIGQHNQPSPFVTTRQPCYENW